LIASHASGTPRPSVAASLFLALRPAQWTKNLIVFAALIFGQRLLDGDAVVRATVAFLAFCALSGVVYVANDVVDRESDRQHPQKRHRPIAAWPSGPRRSCSSAGSGPRPGWGSRSWCTRWRTWRCRSPTRSG
jgi:hypothetical protein